MAVDQSVEGKKMFSYFRDVRSELKKVTWTSKSDLIFCTKAVIMATFIFGFTVYAIDLGIGGCLKAANSIFQAIFG